MSAYLVGSLAVVCLGALAACGDAGAGASTQPTVDAGNRMCAVDSGAIASLSNNSAALDGVSFGLGTTSVDDLRKSIRIDLLQPEPRLTMGSAYAMRDTTDETYIEIGFVVTNVGPTSLCFAMLEGFRLKDAMGADLIEPPMYPPFVQGSVAMLDSSLWTDTCLQPGETGWVLDIEGSPGGLALYAPLAAIEFQYDIPDFLNDLPGPRVVPDGYTVSDDGFETVCFTNVGQGQAAMTAQTFSKFVALDDTGAPLEWEFLTDHIRPVGLLQPGDSGSASTQFPSFYEGNAHRMRAFIDFQSPGTSTEPLSYNAPQSASADDSLVWNRLRTAQLSRDRQRQTRGLSRAQRAP